MGRGSIVVAQNKSKSDAKAPEEVSVAEDDGQLPEIDEIDEAEVADEDKVAIDVEKQFAEAKKSTRARTKASLDPTQIYLREIGFSPLLTFEEELKYARAALQGDESARRRMIESNLRLVVKISRRYLNRGLAFLDLIEEGNLGLMHAIEKF